MVSFAGYPLGGYAALLLTGRVDGPAPALAGGLLTGAILGAIQVWALGRARPHPWAWVLATAVGLMVGVAAGAALVDYRTDLGSLVVQGAVAGTLTGIVQAVVLVPRLGARALLWPPYLGGAYAIGWAVTTSAGIDVDRQFTVFGASGALVVVVLTTVLPLVLGVRRGAEERTS
ncbi:hypothetical protein [Xylanimonas ulmi]|uniref:Uncharacterized protein n=1 Tax=Xylanimonas ulmi TaxID=228973 RepID=A0A4Q7M2R9_9MICO|nr:hypothetical protein [Xylanibacterium ulmi]RZS60768.1 hypothetical protein EV386_1048 [Xylanibacterium ulmi]